MFLLSIIVFIICFSLGLVITYASARVNRPKKRLKSPSEIRALELAVGITPWGELDKPDPNIRTLGIVTPNELNRMADESKLYWETKWLRDSIREEIARRHQL